MKPILKFLPGELIPQGRCIYLTADMVLEYEPSATQPERVGALILADVINQKLRIDKPGELLLIADTLTLKFNSSDYSLYGFDAYTNKQLWTVSSLYRVPEISGQGLLFADPTSFEGDRYSLCLVPKYEIASDQQWIRIVFSEASSDFHYKVASNIVVGLKNGVIMDMYLLGVVFL